MLHMCIHIVLSVKSSSDRPDVLQFHLQIWHGRPARYCSLLSNKHQM